VTASSQAVARQLGLGRETVRRWVVQAEIDAGGRTGVTSAEHAEIKPALGARRRGLLLRVTLDHGGVEQQTRPVHSGRDAASS
jgi:transposase-like protein